MRNLSGGRLAVLTMFFVNGALFANWVARIPTIQEKFALDKGQLGFVLLGISAGVLVALSLAGGLIARYNSRLVTLAGALVLCATLPLLAILPSPVALWVGLFVFGMGMSTMDIAMNAQGVAVEQRHGKPMMSSFHAAWSIGGFAGAAFGAVTVSLSLTTLTHFVIAAVLFLGLALAAFRHLITVEGEGERSGRVFRLPGRSLWPLGAIVFCAGLGEGTMSDWSGVYLESVVLTEPAVAALGFAAFSLMMTVGRALGDWLAQRYSPSMLVRIGGLVAAAGFALAIIIPQTLPVLVGFALVGGGLSIAVPLTFSAAGNVPGVSPGVGIAGVATIGYASFLAGPPIIGLISEATSLRVALTLVALMVASLLYTARAIRVTEKQPVDGEPSSV